MPPTTNSPLFPAEGQKKGWGNSSAAPPSVLYRRAPTPTPAVAAFGLAPFAVSSSAAAFARSAGPTAAGGIGALAFPLSAVFPPLVTLSLTVAFSLTGLLGFQLFAPAFPFSGASRSLGLFLDTLRGTRREEQW